MGCRKISLLLPVESPLGITLAVNSGHSYRFGFNGKEKDTDGEWGNQTHYDYGFRIYNPSIGKFLSVDPLAVDYSFQGSYTYAINNPILFQDILGMGVDGIGVNESGKVVYDDGKKDGNLYYFGDYTGDKLSSMSQVSDKGITFTTAVENYKISDQGGFENFVNANLRIVGGEKSDLFISSFGSITLTNDRRYKMQLKTYTDVIKQPDGSWLGQRKKVGEFELKVSTKNHLLIDNIHMFRSTLAHETSHLLQAFKLPILSFSNKKAKVAHEARMELDAYRYQKKHWTWDMHPDKNQIRRIIEGYKVVLKSVTE